MGVEVPYVLHFEEYIYIYIYIYIYLYALMDHKSRLKRESNA